MMISAPKSSGFCKAGVQKQLSTANKTPASCAILANSAISQTSVNGFEGVSTKNNLVFFCTAVFQASGSVSDTKVTCKPQRARMLLNNCTLVPKILRDATTWSPVEHMPMTQAKIADI